MTGRERLLTALNNEKPDRLPCQVHAWMDYYLKNYLEGIDSWQAYENFGMDYVIYVSPNYHHSEKDLANWQVKETDLEKDERGNLCKFIEITTPKGTLCQRTAMTDITVYVTEYLLKDEHDFEIWNEFYPVPEVVDFEPIQKVKDRLGDKGIIRSHPFSAGQGSPWQSFCTLFGTEQSIILGIDQPGLLHHILDEIVRKTLRVTEMWLGTPADMVEVGGGAGSNTVISPDFYREFGLPYDQLQNRAFHEVGVKVVNHLCGGVMAMLALVVESGADGLETMTPVSMGGDCDLREASRRVGSKLFFIGGFDQNAGFEKGTADNIRQQVQSLHSACPDGGYICSPSDHFFSGKPENIKTFVDCVGECTY